MPEDPRPAANEDAAEGDPAVIDRELARHQKQAPKDAQDKRPNPK
ncbi:hypothetical protein [Rhizobium sp. G21]|nr:hypothetical protein [Rhizobium sp. G21]